MALRSIVVLGVVPVLVAAGVAAGAALDRPGTAVHTETLVLPAGFPASAAPQLPAISDAPALSPEGATALAVHDQSGCDGTCSRNAHWGSYRFGSEVAGVRAFWLIDRTGNARSHDALRTFVDRWNRDVVGRQGPGQDMPIIGYARDDAYVGQCSPNPAAAQAWHLPGYSLLLVCDMRVLDAMGRAFIVPGGPHWGTGLLPWVTVDSSDRSCGGLMTHEQLVSAFAHEIGHAIGFDHRSGVTVMNTNASGVCAGKWFDDHDRDAVGAIYQHQAE